MTPQPATLKLDQLTGWRFVAAFGVILCHFSDLLFPHQSQIFLSLWKGMANFVGFFFILSGFILAYNYQSKIVGGKTTTRSFLVARFARIYPALIFSLLISLPVFLFLNFKLNIPWQTIFSYSVGSILLIKTWIPLTDWGGISPWNGPTWSIETEFFFYLCFPIVIKPLAKLRFRANLIAWIALELLMIFAFGLFDLLESRAGTEPFFGAIELFHSSPYFCVLEFILGIVTYNIARGLPEKSITYLRSNAGWIFALLVAVYALLNVTLPFMSRLHGLPGIVFSMAILLSYTSPPSLRVLQSPRLLYLGEISFSLYLLHIPVLGIFSLAAKVVPQIAYIQTSLSPLFAIATIASSFGLAAFCMKFIEAPWREKIRRALSTKPIETLESTHAEAA